MQPRQRFKKTLLAGAFILSTGNAFNASADNFPVVAEAVPDVAAAAVAGFTQVSFGTGVIGNKNGDSCIMQGFSEVADDDLLWDKDGDNSDGENGNVNGVSLGTITGAACVANTFGEVMIIEIEGAATSTVSVTVADVVGTGYVYTPTAQSCVIDFDRTLGTHDSCVSLATNTVAGIGMSDVQADGVVAAANAQEVVNGAQGFLAMTGKTRMILAGSITLTADLGQGTVVNDNIIVQVTYE